MKAGYCASDKISIWTGKSDWLSYVTKVNKFLSDIKRKNKDILIFASAGNDSARDRGLAISIDGVLPTIFSGTRIDGQRLVHAVGATDETDAPANFSNVSSGGSQISISARGVGYFLPNLDGASKYSVMDGTSFSSPMVAGTAALLRSIGSLKSDGSYELKPDDVVAQIYDTGRATASSVSGRTLDAGGAIACSVQKKGYAIDSSALNISDESRANLHRTITRDDCGKVTVCQSNAWKAYGDVSVVDKFVSMPSVRPHSPATMGVLRSNGTQRFADSEIEKEVGLLPGSLDSLIRGVNASGNATVGSVCYSDIALQKDDEIEINWNLIRGPVTSGTEFAFASLGQALAPRLLATVNEAFQSTGNSSLRQTGWRPVVLKAPGTGIFRVAFGVIDERDSFGAHLLLLDTLKIKPANISD